MKKTVKKIAIFNQKGGTGKTLTTFNIAGLLADMGYFVLVIDVDPQGNLSNRILAHSKYDNKNDKNIVDLLSDDNLLVSEIIKIALMKKQVNFIAKNVGIDCIPANERLYDFQIEGISAMKNRIEEIEKLNKYDFILFDCPPVLNNNMYGVLSAAEYVLIPMTVEDDAVKGYGMLIDTIGEIKATYNPMLNIIGVFLTGYEKDNYNDYIFDFCKENFGSIFIPQLITKSTYVKQANTFSIPICWYRKNSKSTGEYRLLVKEIIKRMN